MAVPNRTFWSGKRVLLTGHTGFKGSWAALWLSDLGAKVTGLALAPEGPESHFGLARVETAIDSRFADIRDAPRVARVVAEIKPEIVVHMAAQALVRRSYADPSGTWESNVNGTLNLLEALRAAKARAVTLIVTSDKVYKNDESGRPFIESDPLGGHDPYSASKAACEILASSWRDSYGASTGVAVATARAGNVIGGGDFSADRIVPDVWRAARESRDIALRNPEATRPWQHVLDCLNGYFLYVEALASRPDAPAAMNFGPAGSAVTPVSSIASALMTAIRPGRGWTAAPDPGPREMSKLALDAGLARRFLGWRDHLPGDLLLAWTADWYKACAGGRDMRSVTLAQIEAFMKGADRKI
jgi:CDP-glucose 4,6-dehydratase